MSIHGICFDEGMSGNCGFECEGFIRGECDIPEEIVEQCPKLVDDDDFDDLWREIENVYGLKREDYESLRKTEIHGSKKKYPWYKSWMSRLHTWIYGISKK